MKLTLQSTSIIAAFLFTGCVTEMPDLLSSNLDENTNNKTVLFKTNKVHFMSTLKSTSSMQERNAYLDEFILKSDMQCQNYLNSPLKQEVDKSEDSLYMSLFDGVSTLFGVSLLTNTAKAVFLNDDGTSTEEKKAYANALSPEIRKGVELGRSRYARSMTRKKALNLKAYSVNNLREDTLKYDKQCNDAYGLIEINRALKEMQNSVQTQRTPSNPILKINPQVIKAKVEAVTKEVEKKKVEKEKAKLLLKKTPATPVVPTRPKLENVPLHHDNVLQLPRLTQP